MFKVFTFAFPAQQDTTAVGPVRTCPERRPLAVYRQGVKVRHRHTVGAVAAPVQLWLGLSLCLIHILSLTTFSQASL